MKQEITKLQIQNELDLVLSYRRAKQLADFCGMNIGLQTKFATAVSEICRNVIEHVGLGSIYYSIVEEGRLYLEAQIVDFGRGIPHLEMILNRKLNSASQKGCGIINSRKLVDNFMIQSNADKGTKVTLRMHIPSGHPPINKSIIVGWMHFFENEVGVSPYEEIKKQNNQLLEVIETLRLKNHETEEQLTEIKRLNGELDKFAYTVSHDLKAPLNNIYGIIQMIHDSIDTNLEDVLLGSKMLEDQVRRMGSVDK